MGYKKSLNIIYGKTVPKVKFTYEQICHQLKE